MVTIADIRNAVADLGLSGLPVCVHSSLRSFGWVEGGPESVVNGILAEGCTLLVPTFTDAFSSLPAPGKRIRQNGWDYKRYGETPTNGPVFTPCSNDIDEGEMGAIPAAVLRMEGRIRGNHPLNSFTAIGPLAGELVSGQHPLNVYAPLEALTRAGGSIILMGVGPNKMTFIHYAEQRAGRNPFIRWATSPGGSPIEVQVGGCSDGFPELEPVLCFEMKRFRVGESTWKVFDAAKTLDSLVSIIREDPFSTHCGDLKCERCNDAFKGGPILR